VTFYRNSNKFGLVDDDIAFNVFKQCYIWAEKLDVILH